MAPSNVPPIPSPEFVFAAGRWSYFRPGDPPVGWHGFTVRVNGVPGTTGTWEGCGVDSWRRDVPGQPLRETLTFARTPHGLVVRRELTATAACRLADLADGMVDAAGRVEAPGIHRGLRLLHSANLRTERYPTTRAEYPYLRAMPYGVREYNVGEGHEIPAYCLFQEGGDWALVEGSLHEDVTRRVWVIEPDADMWQQRFLQFHAEQRPVGATGVDLDAGESMVVSETLYQILGAVDPQDAFDGYVDCFAEHVDTCGKRSTQLEGACYCTWNYGPWHDIHEAELLARARIVAKHFPDVNVFLIDDGYQAPPRRGNGGFDGFYPDPRANWDPARFPRGMKAFADDIRTLGLRPAIWTSPRVELDGPIAAAHPDWLLQDHIGATFAIGKHGYLDLSVAAARAFVLDVLDTLFGDWTYEGLKFDFQSHMFESAHARYRDGTGIQWRNWLYGRIRDRLGPDGFFETCIAMAMGNPHLARHCDGYRMGADISEGEWHRHVDSSAWSLQAITIAGKETALLNMDSFGWSPHVSAAENLARFAWCFITQGLLEFGGKLEEHDARILDYYRRALEAPDRGHGCRVLDDACYTGAPFPNAVAVDYPAGSRTRRRGIRMHVAVFNWTARDQVVGVPVARLGLRPGDHLSDFWTDEAVSIPDEALTFVLPPHHSRLLTVRAD